MKSAPSLFARSGKLAAACAVSFAFPNAANAAVALAGNNWVTSVGGVTVPGGPTSVVVNGTLTANGTLNAESNVNVTGNVNGEGWGWFKGNNLYLGVGQAFQLRWVPDGTSAGTAWMNIDPPSGTFGWREDTGNSFENKMILDPNNILTLYKANGGTAGITFNPGTGKIDINGTNGGGLYSGSTPIVTYATGGITSLTATNLTISGDSYINGNRVGRGGGSISSNSAFGNSALNVNSSGIQNSAYGSQTLVANTTGSHNDAFGVGALKLNTTGTCNVAMGTNALMHTVSGAHNVGVGTAAGAYTTGTTQLTAPSNSIFIGSHSRANTTTITNAIVIGSEAISEGSNTTVIGSSSTTETHLKGTTITQGIDVEGNALLRGEVTLEEAQGDISMGMYAE